MMTARTAHQRRRSADNEALVYAIVAAQDRPLSAYDIAGRASAAAGRIAPAQIYRTLARLIRQGRILRVRMLGAYMPRPSRVDMCLVCVACHQVLIVADTALGRSVRGPASASRFRLASSPVEAAGLCDRCGGASPDDAVAQHAQGLQAS